MSESVASHVDYSQDDDSALQLALSSLQDYASSDAGQLLENFRQFLLDYAKRNWRDEDRRKMGDSDLVQSTLLKGLMRLADFRGHSRAELAGWLRQILKRLIISQRRHLHSQKAYAGHDVQIESLQIVSQTSSVCEEALSIEIGQQVRNAVAALPGNYRQVVEMRHFKQMTFEEIGAEIGKKPDALRKTWSRAILRLQNRLKSQFDLVY